VGRMGSNCIILLGAQEGSNGISLVCGKVSLFLIFKTNVPWFQSVKF
jgi:hypothetical protein